MRFPHCYFLSCRKQTVYSLSHLIKYFFKKKKSSIIRFNNSLSLSPSPENLKDLPDSVCDIFLKKMEKANVYLLSLSDGPSRSALANKILSCLVNDIHTHTEG